jgi:uncharacterized protein (DUF1015 family)
MSVGLPGYPYGVAVDANDNAYVCIASSTFIAKVTPAGQVSVFLKGRWYDLGLKGPAGRPRVETLDVSLLQDLVLDPLLGIKDVRTDKRIDFVGGIRGTTELEKLVNSGKWAVAFSMFATTLDDLLTVSDNGDNMPPKSTWFEPKLRDGLLIHTF